MLAGPAFGHGQSPAWPAGRDCRLALRGAILHGVVVFPFLPTSRSNRVSRRHLLFTILVSACTSATHTAPTPSRATSGAAERPVWPDEGPATWAPRPTETAITANDLRTRLYQFADDSMQGRRTGEVGVTSVLPLRGWGYGVPYSIAGRGRVDRGYRSPAFFKIVSPSYFHALGIKGRAGRVLSDSGAAGEGKAHQHNQGGGAQSPVRRRYE